MPEKPRCFASGAFSGELAWRRQRCAAVTRESGLLLSNAVMSAVSLPTPTYRYRSDKKRAGRIQSPVYRGPMSIPRLFPFLPNVTPTFNAGTSVPNAA